MRADRYFAFDFLRVEALSEARTKLTGFFSILLDVFVEVDPDEHAKDAQNVDFNIES
jgi:hypothetical protein